ncbi:hypothetical protein ANN_00982 [Periplaneta americana]|uniref:Reverse transcriptase domain-containing protein n=1 Tax=Periplaneta americana TaxID=6978 RepID=A0ABQ8TWB9_PERAM|nr:hypothetical protein ANN_00982 [Periplaneta americana]
MSDFYNTLLQELIMKQRAGQNVEDEIKKIKHRILQFQEHIMEGVKTRSRTKTTTEEERASLYQIATEKNRGQKKYISSLTTIDNRHITSCKEILHEAESYYTRLIGYKPSDEKEQVTVLEHITTCIPEEEINLLTHPISLDEISQAIKTSSKHSAPGPDGIGYSFYKQYWDIIKQEMHRLMNELLCTTDSPMGFNEGIILIPKKMTPTIMKDFRPITLLNADCKLFSKIIANRIRPYLSSLLGNEQKCGVPGRSIIENLLGIRDTIIQLASGNKEKAALLSLDFQGAFDNTHHQYMFQIMRRMKIPNLIINAINFLYIFQSTNKWVLYAPN